jgi:molybdopterin converting factor small subunit
MKVTIRLLQPFKSRVGKDTVVVDAKKGNMVSILEALCQKHPEIEADIMPQGCVNADIGLILNDTPLVGDKPFDKVKVSSSDELILFLPISGG